MLNVPSSYLLYFFTVFLVFFFSAVKEQYVPLDQTAQEQAAGMAALTVLWQGV